MTGTEAVSNGVPAFRPPESKNASTTLLIMAGILASLFLGISFLAWQYGAVPDHEHAETTISILASAVFGRNWFYYAIQLTTFLLLVMAANTSYAGFPRLTMLLAQDRFLPRQMANIGDKLVFSNGIVLLAVLAGGLTAAFGGITHHLIPLYSVGVFLSFTLSQGGMVRRWLKLKQPGWRQSAAINGVGALCTGGVLLVVAYTKFASGDPMSAFPLTTPLGYWVVVTGVAFVLVSMYHRWMGKWVAGLSAAGFALWCLIARPDVLLLTPLRMGAWVVIVVIPMLIWMFSRVRAHYMEVAEHLTMTRYDEVPEFRHTVLVPVSGVNRGVMPALKYARSIAGDIRAVYVEIEPSKTPDVLARWSRYVPDIPLVVLASPYRSLVEPLLRYVDTVERERDDDVVTVILSEFVTEKWWTKVLHGQSGFLLKWALLFKKGVVVTNVRYYLERTPSELSAHPLTSTLEDRE